MVVQNRIGDDVMPGIWRLLLFSLVVSVQCTCVCKSCLIYCVLWRVSLPRLPSVIL